MPTFGQQEVQYWQITPLGQSRLQSGQLRGVGIPEKQVLSDIVELGGVAETDELTVGGRVSPGVLRTSLSRLVDLGWVTPLEPQPETATPGTTR